MFDCGLRNGLHARPASHLADVANRYGAECQLKNLRNGLEGDLKSVLAMIAVDVRAADRCRVRVEGEDSEAACNELRRFIEQELPGCDEPLAQVRAQFAGQQFSTFKNTLSDLSVAKLGPITAEMRRLMADPGEIDRILKNGAEKAKALADPIVAEVKRIVGFVG